MSETLLTQTVENQIEQNPETQAVAETVATEQAAAAPEESTRVTTVCCECNVESELADFFVRDFRALCRIKGQKENITDAKIGPADLLLYATCASCKDAAIAKDPGMAYYPLVSAMQRAEAFVAKAAGIADAIGQPEQALDPEGEVEVQCPFCETRMKRRDAYLPGFKGAQVLKAAMQQKEGTTTKPMVRVTSQDLLDLDQPLTPCKECMGLAQEELANRMRNIRGMTEADIEQGLKPYPFMAALKNARAREDREAKETAEAEAKAKEAEAAKNGRLAKMRDLLGSKSPKQNNNRNGGRERRPGNKSWANGD